MKIQRLILILSLVFNVDSQGQCFNPFSKRVFIYSSNIDSQEIKIEYVECRNDSIFSKRSNFTYPTDSIDELERIDMDSAIYFLSLSSYEQKYICRNDSLFNITYNEIFVYTPDMDTSSYNWDVMGDQTILDSKVVTENNVFYRICTINTNLSESTEWFTFKKDFWFVEYYLIISEGSKYELKKYFDIE